MRVDWKNDELIQYHIYTEIRVKKFMNMKE